MQNLNSMHEAGFREDDFHVVRLISENKIPPITLWAGTEWHTGNLFHWINHIWFRYWWNEKRLIEIETFLTEVHEITDAKLLTSISTLKFRFRIYMTFGDIICQIGSQIMKKLCQVFWLTKRWKLFQQIFMNHIRDLRVKSKAQCFRKNQLTRIIESQWSIWCILKTHVAKSTRVFHLQMQFQLFTSFVSRSVELWDPKFSKIPLQLPRES